MLSVTAFETEDWMTASLPVGSVPSRRVTLAQLPTPVHRLRVSADIDVEIHVKRDDLTSFELSGNKVRKLEFLLADALEKGCDSVVTVGGVQSNHCRATAVASRQLGLEPFIILRTDRPDSIDLTGNLLLSRMAGAQILTVTPEEYYSKGSEAIVSDFAAQLLESAGRRCYPIPCGGSNALGSFGYINAVSEMIKHNSSACGEFPFDHIVFGCGSGGTAAGLAIGVHLSGIKTKVHAIGVCDSPDEFYDVIYSLASEIGVRGTGAEAGALTLEDVKQWISIYDGQGEGYAQSTTEELEFLASISATSGITFDPVYSGKALYTLFSMLRSQQTTGSERTFAMNSKILFIHTGGTLGMYDKVSQLLPIIEGKAPITRFESRS